ASFRRNGQDHFYQWSDYRGNGGIDRRENSLPLRRERARHSPAYVQIIHTGDKNERVAHRLPPQPAGHGWPPDWPAPPPSGCSAGVPARTDGGVDAWLW